MFCTAVGSTSCLWLSTLKGLHSLCREWFRLRLDLGLGKCFSGIKFLTQRGWGYPKTLHWEVKNQICWIKYFRLNPIGGLGYQHTRKTSAFEREQKAAWGGGQGLPRWASFRPWSTRQLLLLCTCWSVTSKPVLPSRRCPQTRRSLPSFSVCIALYLQSQLCPSLCWHFWFAFHALVPCTCLQWISFSWFQSVSPIYQDRFSKPVPERIPRLSPALVKCVFQQWALFSNYSPCKKQYRCHR